MQKKDFAYVLSYTLAVNIHTYVCTYIEISISMSPFFCHSQNSHSHNFEKCADIIFFNNSCANFCGYAKEFFNFSFAHQIA